MGLFDSFQFDPQGYNPIGGLLQRLQDWQWQQQGQGFPPMDGNVGNALKPPVIAAPPADNEPQRGAPISLSPPPMASPQAPQISPFANMFNGISNGIAANPMTLMALGSGIMQGGFGKGLQLAMTGSALDQKNRQTTQAQNATIAALKAKGFSDAEIALAASSPEAMKAAISKIMPTYSAHNVGNTSGAFNPATGEFRPSYVEPKIEKIQPGESIYQIGGQPGGQRDATVIASGGPEKPPAGFEWVDKNDLGKGMTAIPGGPGTQLPSEAAGRMSMMETAVRALPDARRALMQGRGDVGLTSGYGVPGLAVGAGASYANLGEIGRAQRTVTTAIEGALRIMTGAAAPSSEVKRYEGMFMPSPFDSKETATQKLNQLEDFISNAKRFVTQGRGGLTKGNTPSPSDPLGIR